MTKICGRRITPRLLRGVRWSEKWDRLLRCIPPIEGGRRKEHTATVQRDFKAKVALEEWVVSFGCVKGLPSFLLASGPLHQMAGRSNGIMVATVTVGVAISLLGANSSNQRISARLQQMAASSPAVSRTGVTTRTLGLKCTRQQWGGYLEERIMAKTEVRVIEFESNWDNSKQELTFRATGQTNTNGWTNPELLMDFGGGAFSFKLVADEPTAVVGQVISRIEGSRTIKVQIENWNPKS